MKGLKPEGAILIFEPRRCTGCLSCQMSCALLHGGSTRPADARVRVVTSGSLGHPTVTVSVRCDCRDEEKLCERVCGPRALRFVREEQLLDLLWEGWHASPVVE